VAEFYQQQAILPVALRENQAYSAITGVTSYTLNETLKKSKFSYVRNPATAVKR